MGVQARIVIHGASPETAKRAARDAFERIDELERVLSDYRDDSEVAAVCRASGGPPVDISADLAAVLAIALDLGERSDGAFDVTVGPLVALWRIARRTGTLPDRNQLADARAKVGLHLLELRAAPPRLRLAVPGMRLDFGGIGKGYAADAALSVLAEAGCPHALVDIGGDLALGTPPPGRATWHIAVDPKEAPLEIGAGGVATSGDNEQHLDLGGVRYSHILDPRTGIGLTTRLRVTILAASAAGADGLASAVSVLGPTRGLRLADETPGAAARIESSTAGDRDVRTSARWPAGPPR